MSPPPLTKDQERVLRAQVIDADRPGPVLHDFQAVLDYVGDQGVPAGGKFNLLPIQAIGELDGRLARPLRLELKRPQLKSHPYLQGLHLLLRASGLSRVAGVGDQARLVLDPALLGQWRRLNPTEQYFTLLEAGFRIGRPEMVGERGTIFDTILFECLQAWKHLPARGARFAVDRPQEVYVFGVGREFYHLALMDLFGLLAVEHARQPVKPWCPAGLKHVPFGDAVLALLAEQGFGPLFQDLAEEDADEDEDEVQEDAGAGEDEGDEVPAEEDEEGPWRDDPQFGVWQPLFQPYFPEWRANLVVPEAVPRAGTYVFRVALGKVWRRIAIPADDSLEGLAHWILRSVQFDDDHLYEFRYRDHFGRNVEAHHPSMDEPPWTPEVRIGDLPLEPGQSMTFLFDFGDNWKFDVLLERIDPPGAKAEAARILEKHGAAPKQYPMADDW